MLQTATNTEPGSACWLEIVGKQVSSLRFGVVQIVVHDGRVVQIERTEKVRLDKPSDHDTRRDFKNAYQSTGGTTT